MSYEGTWHTRDIGRKTAPDHEQAERRIREKLVTHPAAVWAVVEAFDAICDERVRLAAQLAEAREALAKEAQIHIRESARANTEKGRADRAEAQLAEREREIEQQREVLHQIVGFSRTVQGDHPTVRAIAANADRLLASTHSDSEERG